MNVLLELPIPDGHGLSLFFFRGNIKNMSFLKPIMIITFLGHHHFKGTLSFYLKVLNISVILLLFLVVD